MRGAIIVLLLQFGGKKFNMLLIGARAALGLLNTGVTLTLAVKYQIIVHFRGYVLLLCCCWLVW